MERSYFRKEFHNCRRTLPTHLFQKPLPEDWLDIYRDYEEEQIAPLSGFDPIDLTP